MKTKYLNIIIFFLALLLSCKDKPTNNNGDDGEDPPCAYCPFDFRLTDFESAWSPDGKTIAYIHGDTAGSATPTGIYFINPDGTNKRLFFASASASTPDWSPDGNWIIFEMNKNIYKIKVTGDSLIQLTFEGNNFFPSGSYSGNLIAYNKSICEGPNTCGIWIISSDGANQKFISDYGNYPNWNPINSKIIYITRSITPQGEPIGDLVWIFDVESNTKSILASLSGQNFDNRFPKYSPDGTKIAFTSQPDEGKVQIWTMDSDGKKLKQLTTTQGYYCDWSPDGERIVYTDSRAVNGRLWIMSKDGSNKRQLTF